LIADEVAPSLEVVTEERYRTHQGAISEFAAAYRAWDTALGDLNVLEHMDPIEQRDAAYECGCGQNTLPTDRTRTCNCFGNQNAPTPVSTPDLMLILNPKEAPTVEPITTTPDAPYGHKADGSPRKRPAPTAATLAKASATRAAKANGRSPEPKSRFLERMIGELDTEIATLTEARDVLLAVAA
jgi:hypothetical protein